MVELFILLYVIVGGFLTVPFMNTTIDLTHQLIKQNNVKANYGSLYLLIFVLSAFMTFITPIVYISTFFKD